MAWVRNEELRVGDVVRYSEPNSWVTITAIRLYEGPLTFVWAVVDTRQGMSFALECGGWSEVDRRCP